MQHSVRAPGRVGIKGFWSIDLVQLPLDGLTILFGPDRRKDEPPRSGSGRPRRRAASLRDQRGASDAGPSSVDLFLRTSLILDGDRGWRLKVLRSNPEDVIPQDLLVTLRLSEHSRSEFGRRVDASLVMLPKAEDEDRDDIHLGVGD